MSTLPFQPGRAEHYRTLRGWLLSVGYTPAGICARVGVPSLAGFRRRASGQATEVGDALDLLIGLFLEGGTGSTARVRQLVPSPVLDSLRALGIVRPAGDDGALGATVSLYPVDSLYIASDLSTAAPGALSPEELDPPDLVFSAITGLTGTFLESLPTTPCGRLLDLCSGTGVAALLGAARAEQAWAVDITERATRFAEFNRTLNGIDNFTALRGDLYDAVPGMMFDRIVAHPPYVPAEETTMIYRDGGVDGEDILRRVIAGVPAHLVPGGCFHATFRSTDRARPLEDRLREMLGEHAGEFDVLLVTHYEYHPIDYYARVANAGLVPFAQLERYYKLYRELEAGRLVYASLLLQRHDRPRPAFTLRRARAEASGWREAEWLRWWATAAAAGDWAPLLLDSRPVLSPDAQLHIRHGVEGGEWKLRSCEIETERPYPSTVTLSHNMALLLTAYDGSITVRDQLAQLRHLGALPTEVPDEVFLSFLREMVMAGVLRVEAGPPLPQG